MQQVSWRKPVSSRWSAGVTVCAALAAAGCVTAQLEETRSLGTQIAAGEGVVLLAKPRVEGSTTEDDFLDCVSKRMARQSGIRMHGNDEFQDSLFPWFEPATAPQRAEGVTQLLERQLVRQRVADSGVRYIVWVDGVTRKTDSGGGMSCAIGPGGGGCIGFGWWEKESDYDALVWDLKQARTAGTISTNVVGTSAMVGVIVPLPFIARVQGAACDRLADQIAGFLRGEDPSVEPG